MNRTHGSYSIRDGNVLKNQSIKSHKANAARKSEKCQDIREKDRVAHEKAGNRVLLYSSFGDGLFDIHMHVMTCFASSKEGKTIAGHRKIRTFMRSGGSSFGVFADGSLQLTSPFAHKYWYNRCW